MSKKMYEEVADGGSFEEVYVDEETYDAIIDRADSVEDKMTATYGGSTEDIFEKVHWSDHTRFIGSPDYVLGEVGRGSHVEHLSPGLYLVEVSDRDGFHEICEIPVNTKKGIDYLVSYLEDKFDELDGFSLPDCVYSERLPPLEGSGSPRSLEGMLEDDGVFDKISEIDDKELARKEAREKKAKEKKEKHQSGVEI